jgi:hypothetical protein
LMRFERSSRGSRIGEQEWKRQSRTSGRRPVRRIVLSRRRFDPALDPRSVVSRGQPAGNHVMKSRRFIGFDIHETSGSGRSSASRTVSHPRESGILLFVPLRVIHSNRRRLSQAWAICMAIRTSWAT